MNIKLKHPKTCNHCPAFLLTMFNSQMCSLGYKIELSNETRCWNHYTPDEDLFIDIKPSEPCPKPKNIRECVEIRKIVDVNRYSDLKSPEYKSEHYQEMTEEESLKQYVNYSFQNK